MTLKLAHFCDDPKKISTKSSYPVILFGHLNALYGSHSQSKNGLYFPNFMYLSTYFPIFYDIYFPNMKEKAASQNPK